MIDELIKELKLNPLKSEELFDVLNQIKNDLVVQRNKEIEEQGINEAMIWFNDTIKPKLKYDETKSPKEKKKSILEDGKLLEQNLKINAPNRFRSFILKQKYDDLVSKFGEIKKELKVNNGTNINR